MKEKDLDFKPNNECLDCIYSKTKKCTGKRGGNPCLVFRSCNDQKLNDKRIYGTERGKPKLDKIDKIPFYTKKGINKIKEGTVKDKEG